MAINKQNRFCMLLDLLEFGCLNQLIGSGRAVITHRILLWLV
ncbi:Uncharacterised protein [Vibrio cholerae]|nr:Uncharacterised protein [Vibrio cholerae]